AAYASLAVGTVSTVLNRPDTVAEPTRSRVRDAMKQLGFIRNESARQLRAGRSRTIGLVVLDVANPFFTDVARGVEDEASESGLAVILCNSDDQQAKETHYLELLEEHRVQGILITPVPGPHGRHGHRGNAGRAPADRRLLRERPAGAGRPAGDDRAPDPGSRWRLHRRLRRHRLRRRGGGAAFLGAPATAPARPDRGPAPAGGG